MFRSSGDYRFLGGPTRPIRPPRSICVSRGGVEVEPIGRTHPSVLMSFLGAPFAPAFDGAQIWGQRQRAGRTMSHIVPTHLKLLRGNPGEQKLPRGEPQ